MNYREYSLNKKNETKEFNQDIIAVNIYQCSFFEDTGCKSKVFQSLDFPNYFFDTKNHNKHQRIKKNVFSNKQKEESNDNLSIPKEKKDETENLQPFTNKKQEVEEKLQELNEKKDDMIDEIEEITETEITKEDQLDKINQKEVHELDKEMNKIEVEKKVELKISDMDPPSLVNEEPTLIPTTIDNPINSIEIINKSIQPVIDEPIHTKRKIQKELKIKPTPLSIIKKKSIIKKPIIKVKPLPIKVKSLPVIKVSNIPVIKVNQLPVIKVPKIKIKKVKIKKKKVEDEDYVFSEDEDLKDRKRSRGRPPGPAKKKGKKEKNHREKES